MHCVSVFEWGLGGGLLCLYLDAGTLQVRCDDF